MTDEGSTAPKKAPAGWYPHPSMADTRRYWDGTKWTDNIAPATTKKPASQALLSKVAWGISLMFLIPVLALTFLNSPSYGGEDCGTWISPRWTELETALQRVEAVRETGALGVARIQSIADSCNEKLSSQRTICLILLGVGVGARIGVPPIVRAIRE